MFLPTLAAAATISILLMYAFDAVLVESDGISHGYKNRLAAAAITNVKQELESVVRDNAHWAEAVRHSDEDRDPSWFAQTWGLGYGEEIYDAVFLVGEHGETLYASQTNDPFNVLNLHYNAYFSPDIQLLLEALPQDRAKFKYVSGIMRAGDGVATVTAAVISSNLVEQGPHTGRPKVLIFARMLGPKLLSDVSHKLGLDGLQIVRGQAATDGIMLLSPGGDPVAALSWHRLRTGSLLKAKFADMIWFVLSLFHIVVGVLVFISWRSFKETHDSRIKALKSALRDDLTGLANRRQLFLSLSETMAARPKGSGISLVYADLDGFKEVNDAYGHEIGDQLLRACAAGFQHLACSDCLVARLGGDEFAIIVTGKNSDERARRLATNMMDFFHEPMVFGGRVAAVSVSIGIVDIEDNTGDAEEVVRRADVAMYAAKSAGRNRSHVYSDILDRKRDDDRLIAQELRHVIEQRQLEVVYQPIFNARTRVIAGVEALVRWPSSHAVQHPPDVFVPIAEQFGLIEDLGRFVMSEACQQAAVWEGIFVSVNVSPIQFMNPNFAEMVEETLTLSGLEAQRLEVEVTEGFVIDNAERAMALIDRLHELHVSVALDDFGTGYSSIGHLRRFKFDKLKLDRSMVTDILRSPSALRLVQGTIAMADALGLIVTAEGIENENQVAVLRLAGCSYFQGFLFARPISASQVTALIDTSPVAAAS